MPFYTYKCCKEWDARVDVDSRDSVRCSDCWKLASRLVSQFNFVGAGYVGTKRFAGAELALGKQGLESIRDVERAMEEVGAQPVDPYYRPPAPPPLKEITLKELNEYL